MAGWLGRQGHALGCEFSSIVEYPSWQLISMSIRLLLHF